MEKIVKFFRTSPLTRGQIVVMVVGIIILSAFFIIGGIYQFIIHPTDFSNLSFVAVGIILIGFGMIGINPQAVHDWWVTEAPSNDDKF